MDTELRRLQRQVENNPKDAEAQERLDGVISRMGPLYGCEKGVETLSEVWGTLGISLDSPLDSIELTLDRRISAKELLQKASNSSKITVAGLAEIPVAHEAPNGRYFTVEEVVDAVEKTERLTRGQTEWFGDIDRSHCYLEGIRTEDGLVWTTSWGS